MDTAARIRSALSTGSARLVTGVAVAVLLALAALVLIVLLGSPMLADQETVVMAPIRW